VAGKAEPQITKVAAKQRVSAPVPEVAFARRAAQVLDEHGLGADEQRSGPESLPSSLVVGRADDPAEARASEAAARALGLATLRRHTSGGDRLGGSPVDAGTAAAIEGARGRGDRLPAALSGDLAAGFGAPLDRVRVHTGGQADSLARRLDAEAFTVGHDIFFRGGAYDPRSDAGRETIAHEVAHTVQEGAPSVRRFVSVERFKKTTETEYHMRGDALEAIDALLKEYATLEQADAPRASTALGAGGAGAGGGAPARPTTPAPDPAKLARLRRRDALLTDMGFMADKWLVAHTAGDHTALTTAYDPNSQIIDPKRKQRWEGMKVFLEGGTYAHPRNAKFNPNPANLNVRAEQATVAGLIGGPAAAPAGAAPAGAPTLTTKEAQKIQKKYDAELGSVFNALSGVVNMLVPNRGDSAELEVEVKAPVDPHGIGFVGLSIKLELQHDALIGDVQGNEGKDNIVMRVEVAIIGGIQIPEILEVKGKLGVYLEVSADDATRATTLISYGLYRRWRESVFMPDSVCSYLWSGGRAGEFGYVKAEEWANTVEQQQFADRRDPKTGKMIENDAYVETGGLVGAGAKAGVKAGGIGFEVGGEVSASAGRRYDKTSIEKAKGALGATNKTADNPLVAAAQGKGAQQTLGADTMTMKGKAEFKVSPVSGELEAGAKFRRGANAKKPDDLGLESVEFQLVGKFTIPLVGHADSIGTHVIRKVAPALASVPGLVRKFVASFQDEAQQNAWSWTGAVGSGVLGALPAITDFIEAGPKDPLLGTMGDSTMVGANNTSIPKAVADSTKGEVAAKGVALQQTLSGVLTLAIDHTAKTQIEISTEKAIEVGVPLFLSAKAKTANRIVLIEFRGKEGQAAPAAGAGAPAAGAGAGAPAAGGGAGAPAPGAAAGAGGAAKKSKWPDIR
jgi:hypothetical protein